jgi:RNA recognition motif-containing protein
VNIFVGNLAYAVTDRDLRQAFEAYGQVTSASVILDKMTGKSRGFGFVEMTNREEAQAAIQGLNQKDLKGRAIRVNEAQPKTDRPPRREGGGGGFGGSRGGPRDGGY